MEKGSRHQRDQAADALLSAAFISGRRSGLAGEVPSSNPHPTGTSEHYHWELGWRSGNSDRAYDDAMRCAA